MSRQRQASNAGGRGPRRRSPWMEVLPVLAGKLVAGAALGWLLWHAAGR